MSTLIRIVNGTIWDREDNRGQDIKEKWKYELMNMGHLSIDDLKPLCAGNPNLINKTHTLKHTRELWLSWKERAGVDSKVTVTFTAALQNFPGVRKQDRMWQNMMNVTGIMTNEIYIQSSSAGYYAILNKCFPKLFFFLWIIIILEYWIVMLYKTGWVDTARMSTKLWGIDFFLKACTV